MKKLFLGFILLSCLSIQVKAETYIKSIYVKFNATGKGVGKDIENEIHSEERDGAKAISIAVNGNWAYILFENKKNK